MNKDRKNNRNIATSLLVVALTIASLVSGPIAELGTVDKASITGKGRATVTSQDGSSIAYGIRGGEQVQRDDEPVLVFIHGWTCNGQFWAPQIEHFAKNHKVLWLDLAGHGASGSQRDRYKISAFGQDVAAVVETTGAGKVVLIGHSMGGPVALEAADILGDKVTTIVAVDIFGAPLGLADSEEEIAEFLEPFQEDFPAASEKFVRSMFLPTTDQELTTSIVNVMSGADPDMAISAMRELLLWLADSAPASLEKYAPKLRNINAGYGTDAVAQAGSVVVPDVGHFIAQVKPEAFNEALESVLSK